MMAFDKPAHTIDPYLQVYRFHFGLPGSWGSEPLWCAAVRKAREGVGV